MQSLIHKAKLLQLISKRAIYRYGSSYIHSLMTLNQCYCCKQTPIGALHAGKIAEAVFLYVLKIIF